MGTQMGKVGKTETLYAVRYCGCYRGDGRPDADDKEVGQIHWWTMAQILDEVNRGRSSGWTDYDETDWAEGLDEWTWYEPVLDKDGKPVEREQDGFELSGSLAEEDIIRTAQDDDDYYEADFPEWALCALVNGDHFEDKDDEMTYDIWLDRMISEGYDMLSPEVTEDRNGFCSVPEFGLATSTVKVRFRKKTDGKEIRKWIRSTT